jgi:hypothetical protein
MTGLSNPQQPNVASDLAMLAERCIQRPFMTCHASRRLADGILDVSPGPRSRSRYRVASMELPTPERPLVTLSH